MEIGPNEWAVVIDVEGQTSHIHIPRKDEYPVDEVMLVFFEAFAFLKAIHDVLYPSSMAGSGNEVVH